MTEVEFLHKALHSYENIQCNTLEEFNEDLNKFSNIKKLISKYNSSGEIPTRLVLNQIVLLFNVFGNTALDLLLYKIPREDYKLIFPFLLYLNRITELKIAEEGVTLDQKMIEELRKI